jgi:hypothetical protein
MQISSRDRFKENVSLHLVQALSVAAAVLPIKTSLRRSPMTNRNWRRMLSKCAVLGCTLATASGVPPTAFSQEDVARSIPQPTNSPTFLPFAQFQIPFNVDATGTEPALVQLWVSTDEGITWQMHGNAKPDARHFNFRAAAEGLYLFSVRTLDNSGTIFPSSGAPLRVLVDTTKPQAALRADLNAQGHLVIDLRVVENYLDLSSATLRVRTDRDPDWKDVPVDGLAMVGEVYEAQCVVPLRPCREVAVIFAVRDQANNSGEATYKLDMPRTAAGEMDMRLASTGVKNPGAQTSFVPPTSLQPIAGATPWEPETTPKAPLAAHASPGKLAGTDGLSLESSVEELPLPPPEDVRPVLKRMETNLIEPQTTDAQVPAAGQSRGELENNASPTIAQAYHCKSRAFSLDYSVEALGGSALAEVELWGTEDGGRTWNLWGSDPDRQSPFDVQVGNDGLFGFRMVIVGANGIVSNRPKNGDSSDVWINVDTEMPTAKISRAVYGQGPEDGLLVIDYTCGDIHLVDRPITLSFSERLDGPWTTIATGLKDMGIYLWKADPNLPDRIFLKLEVIDKAGNIGTHRLDLPIDIKGLAPRGRIQGFRPIISPEK